MLFMTNCTLYTIRIVVSNTTRFDSMSIRCTNCLSFGMHLCSPSAFGRIFVAHLFSFICCLFCALFLRSCVPIVVVLCLVCPLLSFCVLCAHCCCSVSCVPIFVVLWFVYPLLSSNLNDYLAHLNRPTEIADALLSDGL